MEDTSLLCDICGKRKGQTNHWIQSITPPAGSGLQGIAFGPIDAPLHEPALKIAHLCGQACAHKRLGQYLDALLTPKGTSHDDRIS